MASRQELRALITIAGRIDPSLQSAMLRASGESMRLQNNLRNSGNELNRVSTIAKGTFLGAIAARGFSLITSRMAGFAGEGVKLASDLTEVQNVVDVTFGESAGQINAWSLKAMKAFGLSELSAKNYSSTMGSMLKSSGITGEGLIKMSENLTGLAGDLASFRNLSQDEAFTKIQSGISGETEPLKQIGINMSVANLEAFALSKGIKSSYQNMDQASQTILRYNFLLEHTKDAQGDFSNTRETFANQMRTFKTNTQAMSAAVAENVLPTLTKLLIAGNNWMDAGGGIGRASELAGQAFKLMGDGVQWAMNNSNWLIPVVSGVTSALAGYEVINGVVKLYKAWGIVTSIQTFLQQGLNVAMRENPIGIIVTALGLVVTAGVAVYKNWDWLMAKGKEFFAWIGKVAEPIKNFFGGGSSDVSSKSLSYGSDGMRAYASGGIATRPSIFGEGPTAEMAIPLERSPRSFGLLNQTARILGVGGSSSSSSIVNHINFSPVIQGGYSPQLAQVLDDASEKFAQMLEDYYERKEAVSFG